MRCSRLMWQGMEGPQPNASRSLQNADVTLARGAECVFVNLGGLAANDSKGWCPECSTAIRAVRGASVHAADSAFYEPVDARGSTYVRAEGNGTAALLTGCRFDDAPRQLLRVDGGRIYSDDSSRWVYVNSTNGNVSEPVLPLSALPDTPDGEAPVFLERDNEWLLRVHRVRAPPRSLPLHPIHATGWGSACSNACLRMDAVTEGLPCEAARRDQAHMLADMCGSTDTVLWCRPPLFDGRRRAGAHRRCGAATGAGRRASAGARGSSTASAFPQ